MYRKLLAGFFIICISFSFSLHAGGPLRSMIIFGDSLSDTGNTTKLLRALRQEDNPAFLVRPLKMFVVHRMEDFADDYHIPQSILNAGVALVDDFFDHELAPMLVNLISEVRIIPVLPGEPYWQDRFSNGRVWSEYLASMLHINTDNEHSFDMHAFSGSWATTYDYQLTTWNLIRHPIETIKTLIVGKLIPPSLGLGVQSWLLMHDRPSADDLIFILSGANDYLHVLTFEANYDRAVMSDYIDNVLDGIEYSMRKLIYKGAEKLVIMNLPDVSKTPRYIHTSDEPYLRAAVQTHNERLSMRLENWKTEFANVQFVFIDIPKLMGEIADNPHSYGFTITDKPCIDVKLPMFNQLGNVFSNNPSLDTAQVVAYQGPFLGSERHNYHRCKNADEHLFWDQVHPTTKVHQWFAYKVCNVLEDAGFPTDCKVPS